MALTYDFAFGATCAGIAIEVTDTAGAEVSGSPVTLDSAGAGSLELDEGRYVGRTKTKTPDGRLNLRVVGVLNVGASIESAALLPEA